MRQPKNVIIGDNTLEEILERHNHWLNIRTYKGEGPVERAILYGTDLHDVDLHCADLASIDLRYTNLTGAYLVGADLRNANLEKANLSNTSLCNANFTNANLTDANLTDANLTNANLHNAILMGADLGIDSHNTDLSNVNLQGANICSAKGRFVEYRKGKILTQNIIGYKKCKCIGNHENVIVTLEIPKGAIVFSINGYKFRTNKAKVIGLDGADRAKSIYQYMTYYKGDEFTIYNFDCEYNVECSTGIHFFMTREEAENYQF